MAKQEIKKWYQSKTVWIGILTIAGGVITAIADELATGGVLTGIGILNIILRNITKAKIE